MDGWSLSLMAAKGFSMSQFAANRCGYQSRIKAVRLLRRSVATVDFRIRSSTIGKDFARARRRSLWK